MSGCQWRSVFEAPPLPTPAPLTGTLPRLPLEEPPAVDAAGSTWLGTAGGGVVRVEQRRFERLRDGPHTVSSMAMAPDGALWVLGDGVLWRQSGGGLVRVLVPDPQLELHTLTVTVDNVVWGVGRKTIGWLHKEQWRSVSPAAAHQERMVDIASDDLGRVWVATERRVLTGGTGGWASLPPLTGRVPGLVTLDELVVPKDGNPVVIGVEGAGQGVMLRHEHGGWALLDHDPQVALTNDSLSLSPEGSVLWMSSLGSVFRGPGLLLETDQLAGPDLGVDGMTTDLVGRVWLGTSRGLAVIDGPQQVHWYQPGKIPELKGAVTHILTQAGGGSLPAPPVLSAKVTGVLTATPDTELSLCDTFSLRYARHPCEHGRLHLRTRTDDQGAFVFDEVPQGVHTLLVGQDGWPSAGRVLCCDEVVDGTLDVGARKPQAHIPEGL